MHDDHILSVSALTAAIKGRLEGSFPFVWVRGQVGGVSRPSSGHVYFSLRDEHCSLAAVWFKGQQKPGERFDPLTGEVYEEGPRQSLALSLENGQEIVCAGRLTVYGARGVYQLVVEVAQLAGLGRLHEEFERLRAKLEALGYFAPERKRPLPRHPARVALVTAQNGAAIHDFIRIAEPRGLGSRIRLYPVPVQGRTAPPAIIKAFERIAEEAWAEVIVLTRGGGSLEDLWAFNDEQLARAVYASPVPVLAGIGHEIDYTLADMTADVRAATPSHAAQLLWPAREELRRRQRLLEEALEQAAGRGMDSLDARLQAAARALSWHSPQRLLQGARQSLRSVLRLLNGAQAFLLQRDEARIARLSASLHAAPKRLDAHAAPLAGLEQRLALAARAGLRHYLAEVRGAANALARTPETVAPRKNRLNALARRLDSGTIQMLEKAGHALERAALRLEAVNPHAPLMRGYALVAREDGSFVRSKADVRPEELLRLTVSDGDIAVRVQGDINE